jgi:hypothetical protein
MIDDLRHFDADSFQLIQPETAGMAILILVVLVVIFESVL